jgi:ankyrin repeat protein
MNSRRVLVPVLAVAWLALAGCMEVGGPIFEERDHTWSPLHDAALAGDGAKVRAALKAGADVNGRTEHKDTPLMLACRAGSKEVVGILLEAKARVDFENSAGANAAIVAAAYGHAELLAPLVKRGTKLRATKDSGVSRDPLHDAVAAGHPEVVREILRLDPEAVTRRVASEATLGWHRLYLIARVESSEMVTLLREHGLKTPSVVQSKEKRHLLSFFMLFALIRGDLPLARATIELGAEVDQALKKSNGQSMLHGAAGARRGKFRFPKAVSADLDPVGARRRSRGAESLAGEEGKLRVIEFLLEQGADPTLEDAQGRTPLDLAEEAGNVRIALALRMAQAATKGALHRMSREAWSGALRRKRGEAPESGAPKVGPGR